MRFTRSNTKGFQGQLTAVNNGSEKPVEVAVSVFPIPSTVVLPGTTRVLHVFEPRYRRMVRECVEQDQLLGVSNVEKVVHLARREGSYTPLDQNLSTYMPKSVFCAGTCNIRQELSDGRYLIEVKFKDRYEIVEEVQNLPYAIFNCTKVSDRAIQDIDDIRVSEILREKIMRRLLTITAHLEPIQKQIKSWKLENMDPSKFSFVVASIIDLDADFEQSLLETTNCIERLENLLQFINRTH